MIRLPRVVGPAHISAQAALTTICAACDFLPPQYEQQIAALCARGWVTSDEVFDIGIVVLAAAHHFPRTRPMLGSLQTRLDQIASVAVVPLFA